MTSMDQLTAIEKACPRCGCDAVAWIANSDHVASPSPGGGSSTDQYECRRCKTVFLYRTLD